MEQRLLDLVGDSIKRSNVDIRLTIPGMIPRGASFSLRINAIGLDSLPVTDFEDEIEFVGSTGIEGLPASVKFSTSDRGSMVVDNLKAVGPGFCHLTGKPGYSFRKTCISNAAWVRENVEEYLFFGDLHIHSTYGECSPDIVKDPEFAYAYARDVTCLDFAALADHLRGLANKPDRWPREQQMARDFYDTGKFVPMLGYESSHKSGFGGDNNVYFSGTDAPLFWLPREDMKGNNPEVELRALWDFLDESGKDYITIPHHSGRAFKYRRFDQGDYDSSKEPLFEMFSMWGSSEYYDADNPLRGGSSDGPAYFQDALRNGCRYGVICSSDNHYSVPGFVNEGIACVYARELTREAIWQSLRSRNCYGILGHRIPFDFFMEDVRMGQARRISRRDPLYRKRTFTVECLPSRMGRVEVILLRNCVEIARKTCTFENDTVTFTDEQDLETIAIRDAKHHPEPFVSYYVRVMAGKYPVVWSSPVWLDLEI